MKKKELTWEDIQEFLIKELDKTSHIMTFGTIGSRNVEHDIDLIITKKPSSPSSEFFKEIHNIFEELDSYLYKNFKTKAIRFALSTEEFLVGGYVRGKKVSFHTMIYISFPEIDRDWSWALFKNENIKEIIKNNYQCLYGNVKYLFEKDFQKETKFDNIFIYLYLYDFLNSNLPEKLLLDIMNHSFDYIYKKRLGLEAPFAKNREEAKKYFYELCKILDDKNKK